MARKKVYDIRPPEKKGIHLKRKSGSAFKKVLSPGFFLFGKRKGKKEGKKRKEPFSLKQLLCPKFLAILGTAGLAALFFGLHFSARAEIEVFPAQRKISVSEKVEAETEVLSPDFKNRRIRAKSLFAERQVSGTFEATGVSESATKAEGVIRVVNNYHLKQVLISVPGRRTRFLSADGELFYLQKTVTIPSGGSREVKVKAAEPGPGYNIKPTKFSLPGLLGSPRYTVVYGESNTEMKGGSRGKVAKVTEKDIEKAKEALKKKAEQKIKKELKEKGGQGFVLPETGLGIRTVKTDSLAEPGETGDRFKALLSAQGRGLLWSRKDLASLARSAIKEKMGEEEEMKEGSLDFEVKVTAADLEEETMSLSVEVEAVALKEIDKTDLKKGLLGSTVKESRGYFRSFPKVEKAKIEISPFWVKRVPSHMDRVKIRVVKE